VFRQGHTEIVKRPPSGGQLVQVGVEPEELDGGRLLGLQEGRDNRSVLSGSSTAASAGRALDSGQTPH